MKINVGNLDRVIRLVVGVVLAVLFFNGTATGALGIASLVVGIILILTALFKFCPIYRVLGLNTCPR